MPNDLGEIHFFPIKCIQCLIHMEVMLKLEGHKF